MNDTNFIAINTFNIHNYKQQPTHTNICTNPKEISLGVSISQSPCHTSKLKHIKINSIHVSTLFLLKIGYI